MLILFALGSQCEPSIQWNMGLILYNIPRYVNEYQNACMAYGIKFIYQHPFTGNGVFNQVTGNLSVLNRIARKHFMQTHRPTFTMINTQYQVFMQVPGDDERVCLIR